MRPNLKTNEYKLQAMHSTVRHECVCSLCARVMQEGDVDLWPSNAYVWPASRHTLCLKQNTEHHV